MAELSEWTVRQKQVLIDELNAKLNEEIQAHKQVERKCGEVELNLKNLEEEFERYKKNEAEKGQEIDRNKRVSQASFREEIEKLGESVKIAEEFRRVAEERLGGDRLIVEKNMRLQKEIERKD